MTARTPKTVQHYLNPTMRRLDKGLYETGDGQFRIVRSGLLRDGPDFSVEPCSDWAERMLVCAGLDHPWRLKREAAEYLRGSVYEEPDGWAHAGPEEVEQAYAEALREPIEHR